MNAINRQHSAQCKAPLSKLLRGRFEVFRPAGATRCTDGGEIWHGSPLLHVKFHPHRCNDKGIRPPKLKFLLRFDQNVEYICGDGRIRCAILQNLRSLYLVSGALAVKISLDLLEGLWSYGGFKLTGSSYPEFLSAPYRQNCATDPKSFRGARTCSGSSITTPSLVGLGFHPSPRWPKTLSFLSVSVCLFVTLVNVRACAHDFAKYRRWSTEYSLMPLDRGRFVVVHRCSTFSDCRQLTTSLNSEVQKTAKIRVFRRQRATE